MPRETGADHKSFLISGMGFLLSVPFGQDLYRYVLIQEFCGRDTRLVDCLFHRASRRHVWSSGEIQVLGKSIVAEIAFLKGSSTLEDERILKRFDLCETR